MKIKDAIASLKKDIIYLLQDQALTTLIRNLIFLKKIYLIEIGNSLKKQKGQIHII